LFECKVFFEKFNPDHELMLRFIYTLFQSFRSEQKILPMWTWKLFHAKCQWMLKRSLRKKTNIQ